MPNQIEQPQDHPPSLLRRSRLRAIVGVASSIALLAAGVLGVVAVVRAARLNRDHMIIARRNQELWHEIEANARLIGSPDAPVKIAEFADFECYACARMEPTLAKIRSKYPGEVSVLFLQDPLRELHPYAWGAALASECAGDQQRFKAYHDILIANQASLGVRSWMAYAKDVGVADLGLFQRRIRDTVWVPRIRRDTLIARNLGIVGTPSFMFGHIVYTGRYTFAALDSAVRSLLATRHSAAQF